MRDSGVGVCSPFPKTLTLFMTKIFDFPYPIYDLTKKIDTLFMIKMAKIDPQFVTKTTENHTLWDCTYLYSLDKGIPPGDSAHQTDSSEICLMTHCTNLQE